MKEKDVFDLETLKKMRDEERAKRKKERETRMLMETKKDQFTRNIAIGGLIAFVVLILLLTSVYTVKAGYRGVVLTFGKPSDTVANEGIHLKIPIAQSVKKLEVRTQKIEILADSASKDLQDVQTTIALNFHLKPHMVNKLYQEIGMDYMPRIVDPAIQESVRAVTAKFNAEQLITKRAEVRDGIKDILKERLSKYHIVVDDFNIVNFQFSDEFDKAIEAKVTAEQLKLKAEMDLQRIVVEKDQKIAQAQAEAEALRLQKQEVTSGLIELRRIEAQMKAIEKWNGIMPYVTGSSMPLINLDNLQSVGVQAPSPVQ